LPGSGACCGRPNATSGRSRNGTAWLRHLALDGDLAKAGTKTLRFRLLSAPARLVTHARAKTLKVPPGWAWATDIATAWDRLQSLHPAGHPTTTPTTSTTRPHRGTGAHPSTIGTLANPKITIRADHNPGTRRSRDCGSA